jgi:hypothetical protein
MRELTVRAMITSLLKLYKGGQKDAVIAIFLAEVNEEDGDAETYRQLFSTPTSALAWVRERASCPLWPAPEDDDFVLHDLALTGSFDLHKPELREWEPGDPYYTIKRLVLHW